MLIVEVEVEDEVEVAFLQVFLKRIFSQNLIILLEKIKLV
jgi:hypothetical protein